ncbi:MAG: N-acetylneuraminate synthase family protein [Thermodesulfovibrionales bacterium]|nr:N-acetylneuraminate synthase family protein [Thermodesulfovibrionales bacterium]
MVKIIAEMSASHQQSFQKALAIVWAAAEAGADALKVQMFTPDDMTVNSNDKMYRIGTGQWSGMTLYELYQKACMPYDWIPAIKDHAESRGMEFIATVYHPRTVPIAVEMGIKSLKISSFEINFEKLLISVDKTNLPVIVSTGSATEKEISYVVNLLRRNLTLLKCTSQYPAPAESLNIRTIPDMCERWGVPVGLSDHSLGMIGAISAVSSGASAIEKHITIDGKGLDKDFAILPDRFNMMVQLVRETEKALGEVEYGGKKTYHRELVGGQMQRTVK